MKALGKLIPLVFLSIFIFLNPVSGADKENFSTAPQMNEGKKWRIGYYEGGEYIDYQVIFAATVQGLMDLGWIESEPLPSQKGEQTRELWNWLATSIKSDYIEFVKNAHYTANWDDELRKKSVAQIIKRLNEEKDIDLMIAMGTWAGQDLANNRHHTPTIVLSASDALGAGIIKSNQDSGYDHIHARVDPFRYDRQIRVFHDIIGFKRLGVAYENTVSGRSIAAVDKIEKIARERGFEIVSCYSEDDVPDRKVAEESVKKCFQELAKKVDAIYVTVQNGVNSKSIPELVKTANTHGIPTFSQSGSQEVELGFLVSISQAGYKYIGRFNAETISKVFNGAAPRQIGQVFEEPPKIAINLKSAEIIGFNPPVDILLAADEIFRNISRPE